MFRIAILSGLVLLSIHCFAQGSAGIQDCGCWTEPDSTWTYLGNPGPHSIHPSQWQGSPQSGNAYYGPVNLPFAFGFFGESFNSVYISQNGNISFTSLIASDEPFTYPVSGPVMLAPYWTNTSLLLPHTPFTPPVEGMDEVAFKLSPTSLAVSWSNMGDGSYRIDTLNSFQMVITDGMDPAVPDGNNVAFCYGEMHWGLSHDTVEGFDIRPATVGANRGDGVYYVQAGRFAYPDSSWNGRLIWSGFGWLSGRHMSFNTADLDIPPFFSTTECDTVEVEAGSEGHYEMIAHRGGIAPPMTATIECSTLNGFAYTDENIDGAHVLVASYTPTEAEGGLHELQFHATTGNGLNATTTRYVKVNTTVGWRERYAASRIAIVPNPASDRAIITWPSGQQPDRVEILAMNGAEVFSKVPVRGAVHMELDLHGLPDGIYTVRATGASSTSTVLLVRGPCR